MGKVLLPKFRPHLCKGSLYVEPVVQAAGMVSGYFTGTNWRLRRVVCLNVLAQLKLILLFDKLTRRVRWDRLVPLVVPAVIRKNMSMFDHAVMLVG